MSRGMEGADYEPRSRSSRHSRRRRRHARNSSRSTSGGTGTGRGNSELQRAIDRFEKAMQDLVGSATSEFSDRATNFLNETTTKLERELTGGRRKGGALDELGLGDLGLGSDSDYDEYGGYGGSGDGSYDDSDAAARMRARRRARARARSERLLSRSPKLCRDDENAKIVGVCAGIANYYGVEAWVVRCIAVTGLLFFGSIVFPAYWIMYFVMDDPEKPEKSKSKSKRKRGRRGRRQRRLELEVHTETEEAPFVEEPDRELSPRRNLRNVQADLQEVELRLRRMETHVTSGHYELQRELHKIDTDRPEPRLAASNPEPGPQNK